MIRAFVVPDLGTRPEDMLNLCLPSPRPNGEVAAIRDKTTDDFTTSDPLFEYGIAGLMMKDVRKVTTVLIDAR